MPRPVVVLVGPPGAGKTTVGRRLAAALNTDFVDTDVLIEDSEGAPCGDVFARLGEEQFRRLEEHAVAGALGNSGVVALGGGAVTTPAVRQMLHGHSVVWIDVSAEEGHRRTADTTSRPVLQADDPMAHYQRIVQERAPLYREVASFKCRTDGRHPRQVVGDVLCWLEEERNAVKADREASFPA